MQIIENLTEFLIYLFIKVGTRLCETLQNGAETGGAIAGDCIYCGSLTTKIIQAENRYKLA